MVTMGDNEFCTLLYAFEVIFDLGTPCFLVAIKG